MGKSYIQRMDALNDEFFAVGKKLGIQWGCDNMQIAMLEAKIPLKTIAAICQRTQELVNDNGDALDCRNVEADVVQEKIDAQLGRIWQDRLVKFEQRYEMLKKITYGKRR